MLLESLGLEWEASQVQLALGLLLGALFGIAAQISRFCLRRAVAEDGETRKSAAGVWLSAFFMAILSFQVLSLAGLVDVSGHRLLTTDVPIAALLIGGLAFGAGMVLTRGCVSRLTVLGASGNLRGFFVLMVFAVTAHATLKGVLSGVRVNLGALTIPSPIGSFGELFGNPLVAAVAILSVVGFAIWRLRPPVGSAALAGVIGVLAAVGWAATSVLLLDDFDPAPVQSLAFTLPWSEALFWGIASTAIPAGFGVGLIGGVIGGAFASSVARGEFALQSFESPSQTLRYVAGGVLMGFGGVLAGGCTVGAGLSGAAMLSLSAFIALGAIVVGGRLTHLALTTQATRVAATA